jgi:hypothetical protein
VEHALATEEALAQAERRWAANKTTNYDFSIRVECFCFFPPIMTFHVRDGESSARGLDARTRAQADSFSTFDAIFALLREELRREPARFQVEYHPTLGHPITADIDRFVNAADDTLRFEIVELTPISSAARHSHVPKIADGLHVGGEQLLFSLTQAPTAPFDTIVVSAR